MPSPDIMIIIITLFAMENKEKNWRNIVINIKYGSYYTRDVKDRDIAYKLFEVRGRV